jgi:hypothetical protein
MSLRLPQLVCAAATLMFSQHAFAAALATDDATVPIDGDLFHPAPGADVIRSGPPRWCGSGSSTSSEVDGSDLDAGGALSVRPEIRAGYISRDAAHSIAWSACMLPNATKRQQWIQSFRQFMVNTSGASAQENSDYLRVMMEDPRVIAERIDALCTELSAPADEFGAKLNRSARRAILGCTSAGQTQDELWSIARRSSATSMPLVLFALAIDCQARLSADETRLQESTQAATFASCNHELRSLNKSRVLAALRASGASKFEVVLATDTLNRARVMTEKLRTGYARLIQRFPVLQTVFYDAPDAAIVDRAEQGARWSDALRLATRYEIAFNLHKDDAAALKAAFAGCGGALRRNFGNYMRAQKPHTGRDARDLASDPVGAVLLSALATCDGIGGWHAAAHAEYALVPEHAWIAMGPRATAYGAALSALMQREREDPNLPVHSNEFNPRAPLGSGSNLTLEVSRRVFPELDAQGAAADHERNDDGAPRPTEGEGQIASMTQIKGRPFVLVKFAAHSQPSRVCPAAQQVHYMVGATLAAQPVYNVDGDCAGSADADRPATLDPVMLPASLSLGLKPGMTIRVFEAGAAADTGGFVLEGYSDRTREHLTYASGIPL